eukprot:1151913-Pelagomonas_calceolata.AAC.18
MPTFFLERLPTACHCKLYAIGSARKIQNQGLRTTPCHKSNFFQAATEIFATIFPVSFLLHMMP